MTTIDPSISSLRSECVRDYLWPEDVRGAFAGARDLAFDRSRLLDLAGVDPHSGPFVLTFLTEELFPLGILWARFARRAGITRFAVAAMDSETVDGLHEAGIPAIQVTLPAHLSRLADYRNRNGFNGKALAVIYCRTQITKFLLENDIDVVSCDVDALLAKSLGPELLSNTMVAFQRVAYFPKPLANLWGFTACAGFAAYRACSQVLSLLSKMITIQQEVSSDQLALNLVFLEENVAWDEACDGFDSREALVSHFLANAGRSFHGVLPGSQTTLTALPATTFWRHEFVPLDLQAGVLLHPNSPKPLEGKLEVFQRILGPGEIQLSGVISPQPHLPLS